MLITNSKFGRLLDQQIARFGAFRGPIRPAAFFGSLVGGRDHLLEVFDGWTEVALRLTVQPERVFE